MVVNGSNLVRGERIGTLIDKEERNVFAHGDWTQIGYYCENRESIKYS